MEYKLKIKKYRELKKLTQRELALKIEMSQSFLSEIECEKYDVKLSLLYRIAEGLNVCVKDLLVCNCKKCSKKKAVE